jgi:hypothetical protein
MLANEFIDKLLQKLSYVIPRLQDSITRLQIQFEMQDIHILEHINYFISIMLEYKYKWDLITLSKITYQEIDIPYIYTLPQYIELLNILREKKILLDTEAIWLDDAIHEVIIDSS